MKRILVLGAGQSSPYLISHLIEQAEKHDWFVVVGDINLNLARKRVDNCPRAAAIRFDVNDAVMRTTHISKADVVVNFLAPQFQYLIALECLHHRTHVISASYEDIRVKELDQDANRTGILILNEVGLDPGIDHMSAMSIIDKIHREGGVIESFTSYGSGLPSPEASVNPMKYCITWNPRNVAMAGEEGALYMENGQIKILPYQQVFQRTWPVKVEGVGTLEAYPNRNSLIYQELFGLERLHTMIRGTLRYPGWSEVWQQLVKLGLPNELLVIPNLKERSYQELTQMFLPINISGSSLRNQVANYLGISPTGRIMETMEWLGLFSTKKIGINANTSAEVLIHLLKKKLPLPKGTRDMVILLHQVIACCSGKTGKREKIRSLLVEYGDPNGFTAIAKTVGLPAAIATKLLLIDRLQLTGCHIPTHPAIYVPVLKELEKSGIRFKETREPFDLKKFVK